MEHFLQPRDPRFRRRINEIGQSIENANEAAQSELYIFGQQYIKPCLQSIGDCVTGCVNASCPALTANQRDRLRRQRGRSRGRAELSFDFYDDWDDEENDGLLGWGNDEFDSLVAGRGYGTLANAQPGRQRGMSYTKGRRKSNVQAHDAATDPTVISEPSGWFDRLFGAKPLRYQPSAAGLQEHPGARRGGDRNRNGGEGEALLDDYDDRGGHRRHGRKRSNTASSGHTSDSLSSRGDLFPSDEEDDAIPLDDEFAMVLERRTTQSGPETDNSSGRTGSASDRRRGKRPSAGSRSSTKRSFSSRSLQSATSRKASRSSSSAAQTPIAEHDPQDFVLPVEEEPSTLTVREAKPEQDEYHQIADEPGGGIADANATQDPADLSSKEATPRNSTPAAASIDGDAAQLPTPVPTDDEEDGSRPEEATLGTVSKPPQ